MRPYSPYKIKSVTDTPPERVAHSLQKAPARQSPTPLGPGRNDLFHKDVPDEYIARVFATMASCPQHTFQILTKRHARMKAWVSRVGKSPGGWITHDSTDPKMCGGTGIIVGHTYVAPRPECYRNGPKAGQRKPDPAPTVACGWPLPNVWLGVSVETQQWADTRIPALLDTPAAVRFLSCEPLLGAVQLEMCDWTPPGEEGFPGVHNPLTGEWWPAVGDFAEEYQGRVTDLPRIDWVIVGGESGC
jgi:protein gp37